MMDPARLAESRRPLVFGGSFDPPHRAHVQLPELARRRLGMDAVVYVPAARSPFKSGAPSASAADRLAMLRLALADRPHAGIWTDELDRACRDQPSYTAETLERMKRALGEQARPRLLIGADQARAFDRWHDWEKILELAEPAVMLRPPDDAGAVLAALPEVLDRQAWAARLVELPRIDISSTAIRRRLAAGRPIQDMVPAPVAAHIHRRGLYRPAT